MSVSATALTVFISSTAISQSYYTFGNSIYEVMVLVDYSFGNSFMVMMDIVLTHLGIVLMVMMDIVLIHLETALMVMMVTVLILLVIQFTEVMEEAAIHSATQYTVIEKNSIYNPKEVEVGWFIEENQAKFIFPEPQPLFKSRNKLYLIEQYKLVQL